MINIFNFLKYAKGKDNVLEVDNNGNLKNKSNEPAELVTYLTTEKPEILLKEQEKVKDTDYVEISNNQITLEFSINNAGGADSKASFNAQLFLDSNSDGKFSTTNEGIAANKIKLYCDGTIVNPVMGDDGKYMYSMNAGNYNFKLVYDLPNGLVGVTGLLFDADKLKRSINAALSRRAEANVVTRRYGLRQQVLYLMYYGEE